MTADVEALRRAWREAEAAFEAANELPYPATDMAHSDWHRRREEACLRAVAEAAVKAKAGSLEYVDLEDEVITMRLRVKQIGAERDAAVARAEQAEADLRKDWFATEVREDLIAARNEVSATVERAEAAEAEAKRLREALKAIADGGRGGCHDVAREALKPGPLFARRIPPC